MPAHVVHQPDGKKLEPLVLVVAAKQRAGLDVARTSHHAHVTLGDLHIQTGNDIQPDELARLLHKSADEITKQYDELRKTAPASNVTQLPTVGEGRKVVDLMAALEDSVAAVKAERLERATRRHPSNDRDRVVANRTLTTMRAEAVDGNNSPDAA